MLNQRSASVLLACALISFSTAWGQAPGRIEGRFIRTDDKPISGVAVVISETKDATLTDQKGRYHFSGVADGSYTVVFTLGNDSVVESGVKVQSGQTTNLETTVDWQIAYAETVTVYSASRRIERVVDAPASVTVIDEQEIERQASTGQVPKLIEFTPGAKITQSGIYDFNVNTRGFNSSLNRRVATLVDGRNPSVPFLGAQEWAAIGFPMDDLASVELVRGPSAALYGQNASSGVLNMSTKQPRYSQGGLVRFTAGELETTNGDLRWAGSVGKDWYLKVTGGVRNHEDWSVSRTTSVEYSVPCTSPGQKDCLPLEAAPLATDTDKILFGSFRADKHFKRGTVLTLETGMATIEGPVFQTGIGRVQLIDVERPWARANYSAEHYNLMMYYTGRDAPEQLSLQTGQNLALDSDRYTVEGQTNWGFLDDKLRLVAGVMATDEKIDSEGCPVPVSPCPVPERQTLMFEARDENYQAVFGQVDWQIIEKLKLVLAARGDWSTLHDTQFSPKASLVYSVTDNHSLRLTYNEAFQVANYSEFFLQAEVAAPADFSPFNGICLGSGLPASDCGLGETPVSALGNENLDVEEVRAVEIGYSGIFAGRAFLTIDYYVTENENLITDLIPQVNPVDQSLTNPDFVEWVGSAAAESTMNGTPFPGATVADAIRIQVAQNLPPTALFSNNVDGSDIVAAVSYTNAGKVDTQGADIGLNYYFTDRWSVSASFSWFDFDVADTNSPFADQLLPNTPEYAASAGVVYNASTFDVSLSGRWVDDFRWVVGPFNGIVESYVVFDLGFNYHFNDHWQVGLSVANLLDEGHYEAFGGDILGRRALANVAFAWGQ